MLDAAPLTHRTLGDFTVGEKLGEGGFGVVYRAEQRTLGREAVIKVLHARHGTDETVVRRFLREAQLASRLDHPFAAHIYAFGAEPDGVLWIAMELVRGTTLRKVLDAQPGGRLPLARLVPLLDGLCEVVHTAHEQGIVHRDLKPDNIMVLSRAGRLLPKLLDLGVAKLVTAIPPPDTGARPPDTQPLDPFTLTAQLSASRTPAPQLSADRTPAVQQASGTPSAPIVHEPVPRPQVTQAGAIVGSPYYMAPEQWIDGGPVDARADQYALGVVAFEMIAGRLPFTGASLPAIARAHLRDAVPALPDGAPPALAGVLARALAKQPADRFPSTLAFAEAVRAGAGLRISSDALPRLDDDLRAEIAWLPQPIADAVAELEAARNPHQARDALWQIVRVLARWLGLLALCARSRSGPRGGDSPAVAAALRTLHRRDLTDDEWLDLVRALARPFADLRDAHPIPELVDFALAEPSPFAALFALHADEGAAPTAATAIATTTLVSPATPSSPAPSPTATPPPSPAPSPAASPAPSPTARPSSEESLRDRLARTLPVLAPLLRAVAFLGWYQVIVPRSAERAGPRDEPPGPLAERSEPVPALGPASERSGRAEVWMGTRRSARPLIALPQDLSSNEPVLADLDGRPILQLAPLVQIAPPAPGTPDELFLFAGAGRIRDHGARLVAEPHGFERHDDHVWAWFRANLLTVDDASAAATEHAPYRGLTAFTEADAATFFGRERAVEAFVNQLLDQPLLAVVGPSGTGKSSFIRAGVIPALPTAWRATVVRPGAAPMAALARAVPATTLECAAPTAALARAVPATTLERAAPTTTLDRVAVGNTLVLVVDQLEELFTLCRDPAERDRFAAELARLARSADEPTRVVITLRDDFLARTAELAPLRDRLARAVTLLATPADDDLVRVLVEPARRAGYDFDDGLPRRMVDAVAGRPGALALLSFTALRLWELRDRHFKRLTTSAHDAIGGVEGALARHAEDTLLACTAEEQRLVREAFRHLVTAEGTRATLTRRELDQVLGASPAAQAAIDHLIDARLVVVADDTGDPHVEVIHEALLVAWPRLVEWRREDAEGARLRDQLRAAARQWHDRDRPRGLLWRDDALDDYLRWRARWPATLPDLDQAFGDASLRDAARGRRIRRALALSATAVLAAGVIALSLLYRSSQHSAQVANTALIDSLIQQGQKELFAGDYLRALPFLAQAYRAGDTSIALRAMLHRAIKLADQPRVRMHGEARDARFRPGGRELMVIGYEGDAAVVDATTGRDIARLPAPPGPPGTPSAGTISADGALAALVRSDSIAIWDGARSRSLALGHSVDQARTTMAFDTAHARLAIADGHTVTVWSLAEGTAQWSQPVAGWALQLLVLGDDIVAVTAVNPTSAADRNAWMISPRRVRSLGNMREIAALDPEHFLTIERDRAVRRDITGAIATTYEVASIQAVAISGDRDRIAFGLSSGVIELLETATAKRVGTLTGHSSEVMTLVFSPDGKRLVSMALDRSARIWDIAHSHELFRYVGLDGTPRALWVSADARRLVALTSELVHLFSLDDPSALLVIALDESVGAASFAAHGSRIVTTSDTGASLWDAATGERLEHIRANVNNGIHASPDLRLVAIPMADAPVVDVRELHGGALHATLRSSSPVQWASFDHRGIRIATVNVSGLIELWNPEGEKLATLRGHAATVMEDVEFSPDDRLLLSASNDRTARLWDVESGKELGRVSHKDEVDAARFDPSGTMFATASADKTAAVWDVATRTAVRVFAHEAAVRSVALDNTLLAAATLSGVIQLWDRASGREAGRFQHADMAQTVDLDGDRLLTTAYDGRIVLWDVSTSIGSPDQVVAFTCRILNDSDVTTRDLLHCNRGELPRSR